jgi:hypothetical protein
VISFSEIEVQTASDFVPDGSTIVVAQHCLQIQSLVITELVLQGDISQCDKSEWGGEEIRVSGEILHCDHLHGSVTWFLQSSNIVKNNRHIYVNSGFVLIKSTLDAQISDIFFIDGDIGITLDQIEILVIFLEQTDHDLACLVLLEWVNSVKNVIVRSTDAEECGLMAV